jgi:hypothetical protein
MLRFGTWNKALVAAGLPESPSVRSHYDCVTLPEAVQAIRVWYLHYQRWPSAANYDRLRLEGQPCIATLRKAAPENSWALLITLAARVHERHLRRQAA